MARLEDLEVLQDEALQKVADYVYSLTEEEQRKLYQEYLSNAGCKGTFEDDFDDDFWNMCEWYQLKTEGRICTR